MKNFLKVLFSYCVWVVLIVTPVFVWQKFWIFEKFELPSQVLITVGIGLFTILLLILATLPKKNDIIVKNINEHPFIAIQNLLYRLDNEEDIIMLRTIRRRVNNKIQSSKTNKLMVQATKDICGKNCKCKKQKVYDGCDTCKVYDEYVKYLQKYTKEEN